MNNKVYVKISGLNLSRLLNKIIDSGVLINDLKKKGKSVFFCVDETDLIFIDKVCRIEKKNFEIVSEYKFERVIYAAKRMCGFLLALILIWCYLLSFDTMICGLYIDCDKSVNKTKIEKILNDNGVAVGTLKSLVDINKIESAIIDCYDEIKGCSVTFYGGSLNIKIFLEENNSAVKKEIFSKYNAIITKINIKSGKCEYEVGDAVKQDAVLISDDTSASGDVFGKVCFVATKIYNENQITQKETGRFLEDKTYKIRNKILYKMQNNITFSNYIKEKCVFYIMNNFIIPLKCEVVRYVEVENVISRVPFDVVEKKIKEELFNEAMINVCDKNSIKNISYSVVEESGVYKVDCFIECEIDITK